MAYLRQDQRLAFELVFGGKDPKKISILPGQSHLLENGGELFYLGTSQGYGTCATIRGVNVGVFGLKPFGGSLNIPAHLQNVSYAFLIREASPNEKGEYERQNNIRVVLVELLIPRIVEPEKLIFAKTGLRGQYVEREY